MVKGRDCGAVLASAPCSRSSLAPNGHSLCCPETATVQLTIDLADKADTAQNHEYQEEDLLAAIRGASTPFSFSLSEFQRQRLGLRMRKGRCHRSSKRAGQSTGYPARSSFLVMRF